MTNALTALAAFIVAVGIFLFSAVPSGAITADLAKKCRDMAIQAHPPDLAGTRPYAQAERDYFSQCVSKNGQMQDTNSPSDSPSSSQSASPSSSPSASPSQK